MTAEVAVLNKMAVALAADSSVTIGDRKIYNSANKLFALSKYQPVGIMVFGGAELLSVPWELIIKDYRRVLGTTAFPTLNKYGEHFCSYLSKNRGLFPQALQLDHIKGKIWSYFENHILKDIQDEWKNQIDKRGQLSDKEAKEIAKNIIQKHYDSWEKEQFLKGFTRSFQTKFRTKHRRNINAKIKDVFDKLRLTVNARKQLHQIAASLFCKEFFPENASGIVLAGFGGRDTYPSIITYQMHSIADNKLICRQIVDKSTSVGKDCTAAVIAFAQEDMVHTFLSGEDPRLFNLTRRYISSVLREWTIQIPDDNLKGSKAQKDRFRGRMQKKGHELLERCFEILTEHKQKSYVDPVLSQVHALPKDELAAMAEALVSLTAFKRKVSATVETVGGPIDVCVISKGDGLIWVNRKHYFEPDLNHHFFANYYRA